jgi:pyruvate kinase
MSALMQAESHLKELGIVKTGDVYAITYGEPMGSAGRHQHAADLQGRLRRAGKHDPA